MHSLTIKLAKIGVVLILVIFICYNFISTKYLSEKISARYGNEGGSFKSEPLRKEQYNIWIIFTKVAEKSPLTYKFKNLIYNMLSVTSVPLTFNLLVDNSSKIIADNYFRSLRKDQNVTYSLHDITQAANSIKDIVSTMTPYFSSKPGTYYSDALFYLSLGLYKIAPEIQDKAVMLDCDLYFKKDVGLLFEEFKSFKPENLFGLVPELTPVYRHVVHSYRTKHKTTFGEYFHDNDLIPGPHPKGYQGYNSGVILMNLTAIRTSKLYPKVISKESVQNLTSKYNFKGHLGDQDFYTLLGYEYPNLIKPLGCGFNRQLCTWWRDNGYKDVFDFYAKCNQNTIVLHGNCKTRIPID